MAEHDRVVAAAEARFADTLFAHLARADQRRWARQYLHGLLSTPGRKSVRELAAASRGPGSAADALRQFVHSSPWDWRPVRARLARWVEQRTAVGAWTIGQAIVPKRGACSCGVHRRFVPGIGRTVNCQTALGLFLSAADALFPVDWRLLLPESWGTDARRERARIPATVSPEPPWRLALDLIEQAAAERGHRVPPVYASREALEHGPDTNDGVTRLADALARAGTEFVLEVPALLPVVPLRTAGQDADEDGAARAGEPARASTALSVLGPVHTGPADVRSSRVRLPGSAAFRPVYTVFEAPAERGAEPRLALTNLETRAARRILEPPGSRRTAAALSALAGEGLLDFEGRSFPGWHHHMTLISAAYSYRRLGRRG